MSLKGLLIAEVEIGSIAEEVGLARGDRIKSVNGQVLRDELDFRFFTAEELLLLEVAKKDGSLWEVEIEKYLDEGLGILFGRHGMGNIRKCANGCIFCFVDQMPPGLRKTLYIKDDDFRYSFLHGNFITLTNAGPGEMKRIAEQRLSPLYVSVHAVTPETRIKIINNPKAGDILGQLKELTRQGIVAHTQAVLCPGINDGRELERTFQELSRLWPGIASLAVVPVGLTGYREKLHPIRPFSVREALAVVEQVKYWQEQCLSKFDYPFIFAADEFYVMSGTQIPPLKSYADFPQTENGVGLLRLFLEEWAQVKGIIPEQLPKKKVVILVTGASMQTYLHSVAEYLNKVENLQVQVQVVENKFLGGKVTVAGLLTFSDIAAALKKDGCAADLVILPLAAVNSETGLFLDGRSLADMEKEIGMPVRAAGGPADIVRYVSNVSI